MESIEEFGNYHKWPQFLQAAIGDTAAHLLHAWKNWNGQ